MLSKSMSKALEWSEDDDDTLACRPTILTGLAGDRESPASVRVALAPRLPTFGSQAKPARISVMPPPVFEAHLSARPTRRAPSLTRELASAPGTAGPTGRPSQFPF